MSITNDPTQTENSAEQQPDLKRVITETPSLFPEDDIPPKLFQVDISELLYYFKHKRHSIAVNRLRSGGVRSIGMLMSYSYARLSRIPYIGASTLESATQFQQWLKMEWPLVLGEALKGEEKVYLPLDYDPEASVMKNIRQALVEASEIMFDRINNPHFVRSPRDKGGVELIARILKERYVSEKSFGEIAKEIGKTQWHVTKNHSDFVMRMVTGKAVNRTLYLRKELVKGVKAMTKAGIFSISDESNRDNEVEDRLATSIGIVTLEVVGQFYIMIPAREKCRYAQKLHCLIRVLRETVIPKERDVFLKHVFMQREFDDPNNENDRKFVTTLIDDDRLTDPLPDGRVKMCIEHLVSDEQRMGRIIYDSHRRLTRNEFFRMFEEKFGRPSNTVNFSNLRKYGIHSSGDLWAYGHKRSPMNHYIATYAREKRIFYMSELVHQLEVEGYPILNRVRNYVTFNCLVDNDDTNHFCHKDYVDDYPEFAWRRTGRVGLSNMILRTMRDILLNDGPMQREELIDRIESLARRDGTDWYIRQRVKSVLVIYCGPDKPFLNDNGMISINKEVIDRINFATIGRRGHGRTVEYERIREEVLEVLRETPGHTLCLMDVIRTISKKRGEELSRNSCVRAINSPLLGPLPLTVTNEGGTLILRLKEVAKPTEISENKGNA